MANNVLVLDDFRSDPDFLQCYERRLKAMLPEKDESHKHMLISMRKDTGYCHVEVSEGFTMMELAWVFKSVPDIFSPVEG